VIDRRTDLNGAAAIIPGDARRRWSATRSVRTP